MEDADYRLLHSPSASSSKKTKNKLNKSPQPDPLPLTKKRVPLGDITNTTPRSCAKKPKLSHSENAPPPTPPLPPPFDVLEMHIDNQQLLGPDDFKQINQSDSELEIYASSVDSTSGFELSKCSGSSFIYDHLRSLEVEDTRRPLANYMETVQKDVLVNMREVLVDWLVEVTEEYKLVADTLYLSISYIDRYLSYKCISTNKLQLLGVTCMHIASKYEEINPPCAEHFCYITDNTYTKEELLDMETDVLKVLNYEMGTPTAKNFLRILTRAADKDTEDPKMQIEFLSSYLCELSLIEYGCVCFLPSVIAASSVFLSRFVIFPDEHPWSTSLQLKSGYRAAELKDCVLAIHGLAINKKGSTLRGVRDKFKQRKYKQVAWKHLPSEVPLALFSTSTLSLANSCASF
ncbi:CYCA3-1 [Linum perenne]